MLAALPGSVSAAVVSEQVIPSTHHVPLDGEWQFRLDPQHRGEAEGWYSQWSADTTWETVSVPHTWEIMSEHTDYMGIAWYRRMFFAPDQWQNKAVRVEFEAVFHSAVVWVNSQRVGQHLRKGYTAFTCDISDALHFGAENVLAVQVNNDFDNRMLPRGKSFDWTPDGGITRPVNLLVTPRVFIERISVDALPDMQSNEAAIAIQTVVRNTTPDSVSLAIGCRVDEENGRQKVLGSENVVTATVPGQSSRTVRLPELTLPDPRLWHFDHPDLYRLQVLVTREDGTGHRQATIFGIRTFEVEDGGFYLNGERVRLMGVERMAGSNPEFGMAEPGSWLQHDHDDMKVLNGVFTRTHWPQDKRVLDYCDRHGILIQTEVPTWGPRTFRDMTGDPDPVILQNGLEQLREMIRRDRNHPSIFAWGLCNEINGQHPPAAAFARRLSEEAHTLDPHRLRTYASNSLQTTPENDIAGIMDFIMWNEYYESWYGGTVEEMRRNIERIHAAFPEKPLVISEYGYCECTPDRLGGDPRRIEILTSHTEVYREFKYVGGAIFFDYNDYRTHIGDKGEGVMKQRVHGVVDLYGNRKPSFQTLRNESSPVQFLELNRQGKTVVANLRTRETLPAHTLRGYTLRLIVYGFDGLPMERKETPLPDLEPGTAVDIPLPYSTDTPRRLQVDVLRPTGFSAITGLIDLQ